MKERRKIDPEDFGFLLWMTKSLFCRPPDKVAYEALKEVVRIENGIKSGVVKELLGITPGKFRKIQKGLISDSDEDPYDSMWWRAQNMLDRYICNKYGITKELLGQAIDWQIEQVDKLILSGRMN